jgi:predicted nucleotidyltransferase
MRQRRFSDGVEIISVDDQALRQRLEEIAVQIRAKHPEVEEVVLFGSFARGDFTPRSDVDVAILLSADGEPFLQWADRFLDAFSDLSLDVNLLVYMREEMNRMLAEGNRLARAIVEGVRLGREEVRWVSGKDWAGGRGRFWRKRRRRLAA